MIKEISYKEFKSKMENKESFVFYFGGNWCKNCTPVIPIINKVAKDNNTIVYNLDPRDNNKEPIDDFRKCNNITQELLYKEFIELLGYENEETVLIDAEFRDSNIPRLSVPAIFKINKGKISYELIEEYESLNKEEETYFVNELQTLITHH